MVKPADDTAGAPSATRSDNSSLARGGSFAMVGSLYMGIAGFLLNVAIGRFFGAHVAGVFFTAISIWTIVNGLGVVGSDSGLQRILSGRRARAQHEDVYQAVRLTVWPVLAWSMFIAAALALASGWLSRLVLAEEADQLQRCILVLCALLLISPLGQASINGTRAFAGLKRFVLHYQIGVSTTRVVGALVLGFWGSSSTALIAAWALPLLVVDLLCLKYVVGRALAERDRDPGLEITPVPELRREIWRFNLYRGVASTFETCIVWADVLVVAAILGPAKAGAYAAASRFITTGTMAMEALRVPTSPPLAAAFAQGKVERAREIYRLTTVWLVLLSWPVFFGLATFAPFVLGILGKDFLVAAPAMTVMSLGILAYLAMGNVNTTLLMGGRSDITAANTAVTLALNIGLNLWLVPTIGLVGAAIAWAVSLAFDSLLCVIRGHRAFDLGLPGRGLTVAALVTATAFGVPGLVVRLFGEQNLLWLIGYAVVSIPLYLGLTRLFREPLHLLELRHVRDADG